MRALILPVSGDPGVVWRVGYQPDPWWWTPWEYAHDDGRFNGRWDDQSAQFRTLYTSDSLLGCFLELLAALRPNQVAYAELADIVDDAADERPETPDPEPGAVGLEWLSGRLYGRAVLTGTYAEVSRAEALAHMVKAGVFERLGIPDRDVDVALLKDARQREVTRTVARYLYDLRDPDRQPLVDGIAFRSRMGDDIRLWAVFERGDQPVSERIAPDSDYEAVTDETPELDHAFAFFNLHWRER
ncbi:RES domain-containing protein [Microbacterium trichothecenolyticum]|uniref:RES domain-containing protein n=1 Tax=Microbacterium trichothecenolyticum TaxID=69370 RepID=UPI0035BE277E